MSAASDKLNAMLANIEANYGRTSFAKREELRQAVAKFEHGFQGAVSVIEYLSECVKFFADENRQLRAALQPFGFYYELNDCHELKADDALEVPIADLKRAHELVGGEHPDQQTGSETKP